ncbi:hypothetical protein CDD82_5978 [Ophiocordyceps australis]|uniref:Uncharacterized protein n=1 Tax=Ophiocordyceps australis TaxID=1399860 RepID=A0A2C5YYI8_9HYPO|nr:hypothetical protein CDD82_5978 [Ophiocordyceps australis]
MDFCARDTQLACEELPAARPKMPRKPTLTPDDPLSQCLISLAPGDKNPEPISLAIQDGKGGERPPSSVLRQFDHDLFSDEDHFDPNLNYTPPRSDSASLQHADDPPPLAQEADWSPVCQHVEIMRNKSNPRRQGALQTQLATDEKNLLAIQATPAPPVPDLWTRIKPKQFKTFLRLDELIEAKCNIYKNQPHVILHLFARVLYSSRENFFRKQYFQFRDLFCETAPYIGGCLAG